MGRSHAVLKYNDVNKLYHVLAMYGANVRIVAENYAVVSVESLDANVIVEKKDNAKVFVKKHTVN